MFINYIIAYKNVKLGIRINENVTMNNSEVQILSLDKPKLQSWNKDS